MKGKLRESRVDIHEGLCRGLVTPGNSKLQGDLAWRKRSPHPPGTLAEQTGALFATLEKPQRQSPRPRAEGSSWLLG